MSKRILATCLWLFAGWYAGAALAALLGLPDAVGPVLGIAMAAFIAGDPFHRIWVQTQPVASRS